MTLTPELSAIIVAIIACVGSIAVGLNNNKKLNEVHVIVNNRYSELKKSYDDSAAEVKFLTAALAEAKVISLTDRLAKLEEIKKANGV